MIQNSRKFELRVHDETCALIDRTTCQENVKRTRWSHLDKEKKKRKKEIESVCVILCNAN
jgi:hypothetical protein